MGLAVAFLSFATVGALVASRRPGNTVGWVCCAIGLGVALAVAPLEYVRYGVAHPGSLPAAAWIGWPAMWATSPLYLVAPDERRQKVFAEVNRPTFSRLSPPLVDLCRVIAFWRSEISLARSVRSSAT
jgi:hypothetical protein